MSFHAKGGLAVNLDALEMSAAQANQGTLQQASMLSKDLSCRVPSLTIILCMCQLHIKMEAFKETALEALARRSLKRPCLQSPRSFDRSPAHGGGRGRHIFILM